MVLIYWIRRDLLKGPPPSPNMSLYEKIKLKKQYESLVQKVLSMDDAPDEMYEQIVLLELKINNFDTEKKGVLAYNGSNLLDKKRPTEGIRRCNKNFLGRTIQGVIDDNRYRDNRQKREAQKMAEGGKRQRSRDRDRDRRDRYGYSSSSSGERYSHRNKRRRHRSDSSEHERKSKRRKRSSSRDRQKSCRSERKEKRHKRPRNREE
eukprot:TRINITY_DN5654_c0_g1_i1.p1 TRINITY_DN5654_c0_g1~~TRINITY_DN5654_c0_g1_i1.p1  ORF type:complete len:206 (-),score=39.50 TRINITY_DN5654_c0_g1_i1:38-655(-)